MESREIDEYKSSESEFKIEDIIKSTNNLKTVMYSYDEKSILIYTNANDHKIFNQNQNTMTDAHANKAESRLNIIDIWLEVKQMSTLEIQNLINIQINNQIETIIVIL